MGIDASIPAEGLIKNFGRGRRVSPRPRGRAAGPPCSAGPLAPGKAHAGAGDTGQAARDS
jgi:hypothetical protein